MEKEQFKPEEPQILSFGEKLAGIALMAGHVISLVVNKVTETNTDSIDNRPKNQF